MGHGSSVTYSVQPSSRHEPRARPARVIASRSAWAVGSCRVSRKLNAWETTLRSWTMTDPTGTSPRSAASRASSNRPFHHRLIEAVGFDAVGLGARHAGGSEELFRHSDLFPRLSGGQLVASHVKRVKQERGRGAAQEVGD